MLEGRGLNPRLLSFFKDVFSKCSLDDTDSIQSVCVGGGGNVGLRVYSPRMNTVRVSGLGFRDLEGLLFLKIHC